ncbi:MAG: hypothetical protein ABI620_01545 [Chloroflexota bacterium]
MPLAITRLAAPALAAAMLAACSGTGTAPSPEPTPPSEAKFLLRITQVQALPPQATFGWIPSLVITLDGRVLRGGAVAAIFPGPLVNPIVEQQLTAAGWEQIVAAARAAGLLTGAADFTGGVMQPGSAATRLQIVADGRLYELTGDPSRIMVCVTTPCVPQPGSPEAFGGFMSKLSDLDAWLGAGQLGASRESVPAGYAVIVGPAPDQQGLEQPIIAWPLAGGLAGFGKPLADGSGGRCGTITGDALAAVRPAFAAANQLTRWRDPVDDSLRGLTVRPLLPGDADPCEGLV